MRIDYSKTTLEQLDGYKSISFICDGDKQKIIMEVETK